MVHKPVNKDRLFIRGEYPEIPLKPFSIVVVFFQDAMVLPLDMERFPLLQLCFCHETCFFICTSTRWWAPDPVINGVIIPRNGRKEMSNWGYFTPKSGVISPHL